MPGGYPDAPTQRIPYDLDGSQVFRIDENTGDFEDNYNSTTREDLNNEHSSRNISATGVFNGLFTQWLFTEPHDLFGSWASGDGDGAIENFFVTVSYSQDTRSWNTGTWVDTGTDFNVCSQMWDTWREEIQPFSASSAWGFRGLSFGKGGLEFTGKILRQVHIYGAPTDAEIPDRVILLDKDTSLELNLYDWGFLARGEVKTKEIQVKNNSASLTANTIGLGLDSLNSHDPALWHNFVELGSSSTSISIGSLAPGATYANDITLRVDTPSTAGMGPFTNRVTVGIASWS